MARIVSVRSPALFLRQGAAVRTGGLEAVAIITTGEPVRFSPMVNKTVLRRAVDRNKWRRILKEIARKNYSLFPRGCQCVIRIKEPPRLPLSYDNWEPLVLKILQEAFIRASAQT